MQRTKPPKLKLPGNRHYEATEQRALVRWMRLNQRRLPGLELAFSTLNGAMLHGDGLSRAKQWARLKAEGAQTGVPDIVIPVPRGKFHGAFIEMKAHRCHKPVVSKEQEDYLENVHRFGYLAVVCYGMEEAVGVIEAYWQEPAAKEMQ